MLGVESHRGITGTGIGPGRCCKDRARRQETVSPGFAAIGGSRKPDVGSATIEEAAGLEGGYDGVAKGKGVRLNLRLVITGGVSVRVAADLSEWLCRKGERTKAEGQQQGERESQKYARSRRGSRDNCQDLPP